MVGKYLVIHKIKHTLQLILQFSNGKQLHIDVDDYTVRLLDNYYYNRNKEQIVPYGTQFYTYQALSQFLASYGAWLTRKGMVFDNIENAIELNWNVMIKEYLYWSQFNWELGSLLQLIHLHKI